LPRAFSGGAPRLQPMAPCCLAVFIFQGSESRAKDPREEAHRRQIPRQEARPDRSADRCPLEGRSLHPASRAIHRSGQSQRQLRLERFSEKNFPECFREYAELLHWDQYWHTRWTPIIRLLEVVRRRPLERGLQLRGSPSRQIQKQSRADLRAGARRRKPHRHYLPGALSPR